MTDHTSTSDALPAQTRQSYGVPSFAIAIGAALLYAYVLWNAIGNLLQLPKLLGPATPWWLLSLDITLPVVVYLGAILMGRRSRTLTRAAFFGIGAAVVASCTVGSIAFVHTH